MIPPRRSCCSLHQESWLALMMTMATMRMIITVLHLFLFRCSIECTTLYIEALKWLWNTAAGLCLFLCLYASFSVPLVSSVGRRCSFIFFTQVCPRQQLCCKIENWGCRRWLTVQGADRGWGEAHSSLEGVLAKKGTGSLGNFTPPVLASSSSSSTCASVIIYGKGALPFASYNTQIHINLYFY